MTFQDDLIYAGLLIISVPLGLLLQNTKGPLQKQLISSGIGWLMVCCVCGWHSLHSLITVLVNSLLVFILGPRKCQTWSFIWCFGYIVFFRTTHYLGLPQVPAHANAVQLLLTLKLVGLAFEIHDSYNNKKAAEKEGDEGAEARLRCRYQNVNPSFFDMLFYSYCYVGLLTGPYYKYRTYHDMIHRKRGENIDFKTPLIRRMQWVPLVAVIFLVLSHFCNIEYMASAEILEQPFWFRFLYQLPMFTIFRMRLYFAWMMAECVCMTALLGAYPVDSKPRCGGGPTQLQALQDSEESESKDVKYDFETTHNISIYGCELATTLREAMRSWNMSVQFWLANNVYRRVPANLKAHRMMITMMVSSFWHGIHPGYYLSFMFVPPNQLAEDWMRSAFRDPEPSTRQKVFDWVCWFWKQRSLDYMAMAFLLLGLRETLHYWGSIYYLGHVWVGVFLIVGYLCKPNRPRRSDKVKDTTQGVKCGTEGKVIEENQNVIKEGSKIE